MNIEQSQIDKFAAVYAEAVLTFLDSREPQWITWDGISHRFEFASIELDEPVLPVMLVVDENWERLLGDVGEITDPDSEHYDMEALRNAIVHLLAEEGLGERILKTYLERLEQGEEEDAANDSGGDEDSEP